MERLTRFFDGAGPEFEQVGKAYSGAEGLRLAAQLKPDIVVTDIVMPEMDGIAMIEQLREQHPALPCIILSAYSEFAYAQRAMQLKVSDYIVKVPLDEAALLQALHKAAKQMREQEHTSGELLRLDRMTRKNAHRLRKQLFGELLRGELTARQLPAWNDEMMLELHLPGYCACLIRIGDYAAFHRDYSKSDQRALRYALTNVAEELLQAAGTGFVFEHSYAALTGYVSWPHLHSHAERLKRAGALSADIISRARQYLRMRVSVAWSGVFQGIDGLLPAYRHACRIADELYYVTGEGLTLLPGDQPAPGHAPEAESELRRRLEHLLAAVKAAGDQQAIRAELLAIADRIRQVRLPVQRAGALLREAADDLALWSPAVAARQLETSCWQVGIFALLRLHEQVGLLEELIRELFLRGEASDRRELQQAKAFIRSHLRERLTLRQVADAVGLSPNYFSALFKREEQVSLVEYINREKIALASELLMQRGWSNFELSEYVGIGNERYFCTLFRQYTGVSPQQFRKKVKRV
ncbi:response regulator [Paenibacillus sp. IB182496]|uniref:Response regulator n=1 Tax=Paenibacillus sabuli TaxID=2772509 RepID=A0A927BY73_9BACL|nr:response regulator [Paenibacillus sabuli]MBD2847669.1 response regulator [Paenibacillus sabuli]